MYAIIREQQGGCEHSVFPEAGKMPGLAGVLIVNLVNRKDIQ